ncbi:hypothetical protein [Oceanithermus desulfurans]|uniref:Uncharacterized protein n=2 Tax=Oceanithermus desulfurans TaxID=227924 RepID=A0A511RG51_9DEIN|nr:hypothetical protein [Oceanithermus desulfurans]MBB6030936.1 hypothetical protein [Oceanithermus desulfurans]GEM88608.1 hypothetical protein ODE01S_00420 [Oceanithermus desulfurans NBRC 100063]
MRHLLSHISLRTLLPLFLLYYLLTVALSWLGYAFLALALLAVNFVFALALVFPATRAWGRRMLRHSFVLLALAAVYAAFPGVPTGARSAVKLVGPEGGQVRTPDLVARVVVGPGSFPVPLLLRITSLPLTAPLPDPTLPPEVKLIAAARFEQSHPFAEEWQNFFLPQVQLSLRNAVAPVEGGDYFTEICYWVPPEEMTYPDVQDPWFCDEYFDVTGGDPTQKGSGWASTTIKGFGREGTAFYLFQYPRDWARANCEAAGGTFDDNPKLYSFESSCYGYDLQRYELSLGRVVQGPALIEKTPNTGGNHDK